MKRQTFSVPALCLCTAVSLAAQTTFYNVPSRIVGHNSDEGLSVSSYNANLPKAQDLYAPNGIAVDTAASPPILYVSDTGNNRVLAWKNATSFSNGAPADLVIGQPDFFTTLPSGGTSSNGGGLNTPTGLAVRNGDLYVADSGNNRVLRFPKPFDHIQLQTPSVVCGQPSLYTKIPNYPSGSYDTPSSRGLAFSTSSKSYSAGLAFDASGNLWVVDPINHRVLSFSAADISANTVTPSAYHALGQLDNFTTATQSSDPLSVNQLFVPSGIAIDTAKGLIYVTDADSSFYVNRVLVFPVNSPIASKIIGMPPSTASLDTKNRSALLNPTAVFIVTETGQVGVVEGGVSGAAGGHRIVLFPPYDTWSDPQAPPATDVVNQNNDFTAHGGNNAPAGQTWIPISSATTLYIPSAAVYFNKELYVADTWNHRVIVLPAQNSSFGPATRVLGQTGFDKNSINYLEGNEFQFASDLGRAAGIAIDSRASEPQPHLYVADPGNNRVVGFRDVRTVKAGSKPDLVLGQPDLVTAICNYSATSPTRGGDPDHPNQSGLCGPTGLAIDANGNLYVADTLNGRVLRFPAPFADANKPPAGQLEPADLVLGQQDFTTKLTDASAFNLNRPYGLAFSTTNGLAVSDVFHNRVLYFDYKNGTFTNGQAADGVIGQSSFTSTAAGSSGSGLSQPRHIACDTSGRLYVADSANNRVEVFDNPHKIATGEIRNGPNAISSIPNLNAPFGVFVSAATGEIWVADYNAIQVKRYYAIDDTRFNGTPITSPPPPAVPINPVAIAQDQNGSMLVVADASHRIGIYFPGLAALNGASFLLDPVHLVLAPGLVTALYPTSGTFASDLGSASAPDATHLPATLGNTQVLFNGKPSPLYAVSPGQINFVVPMGKQSGDVPTSGTADLRVVRCPASDPGCANSPGQILAAGTAVMNFASPGIFLYPITSGKARQAAVLNQDGTINSPQNPAPRGSIIQIFGTGQGFVAGAPNDGIGATSPTPITGRTDVAFNGCEVHNTGCSGTDTPDYVKYSGLSSYPGGWQINVQIPQTVLPGPQVSLLVGFAPLYNSDGSFQTVIAVK